MALASLMLLLCCFLVFARTGRGNFGCTFAIVAATLKLVWGLCVISTLTCYDKNSFLFFFWVFAGQFSLPFCLSSYLSLSPQHADTHTFNNQVSTSNKYKQQIKWVVRCAFLENIWLLFVARSLFSFYFPLTFFCLRGVRCAPMFLFFRSF